MAIGHIDIITGQRRSGQKRTDRGQVNDVMFDAKITRRTGGEIEFLLMALAIIKRNQGMELVLGRDLIGQRDGIQPARADDNRLHSNQSFVFLTWCYDRGRIILPRGRGLPCRLPKRKHKSTHAAMREAQECLGFTRNQRSDGVAGSGALCAKYMKTNRDLKMAVFDIGGQCFKHRGIDRADFHVR